MSFAAMCRKVAQQTDVNDHTGSLITAANWMVGNMEVGEAILNKLKVVQEIAELEGCMPYEVGQYRHRLYEQLMTLAEQHLEPEQYKLLRSKF